MKKFFFPFVAILFMMLYYSCTKDTATYKPNCTNVNSATNTYTANIKPILDFYCAISSCHDAATATYGVDLSSYSSTVSAFQFRNVICSVKQSGCLAMPLGGRPLDDSLITNMECWANNNYPK